MEPTRPIMYYRASGELDFSTDEPESGHQILRRQQWLSFPFTLHPEWSLLRVLESHIHKCYCNQEKVNHYTGN